MVIEYAGELIRSTLTDKRERYYDSRGIGCYMFKIDDNLVVDATMRGNAARFINHSCEVSSKQNTILNRTCFEFTFVHFFFLSRIATRRSSIYLVTSTSLSLPCDASCRVRS